MWKEYTKQTKDNKNTEIIITTSALVVIKTIVTKNKTVISGNSDNNKRMRKIRVIVKTQPLLKVYNKCKISISLALTIVYCNFC